VYDDDWATHLNRPTAKLLQSFLNKGIEPSDFSTGLDRDEIFFASYKVLFFLNEW
jgi:hypothetical protein